jgi:hypothetical protein
MPFQYILANLLAKNDGALAVLFVDEMGETIDVACSEFTPYDMKVLGAYVGIYQRQFSEMLELEKEFGELEMVHIEKDAIHLYATPLPDGYSLVLVQRRPGLVARARETLKAARAEMARHIFGKK